MQDRAKLLVNENIKLDKMERCGGINLFNPSADEVIGQINGAFVDAMKTIRGDDGENSL